MSNFENDLNNNIDNSNNFGNIGDLSLKRDKSNPKTIGIPSDLQTKEVFDVLPGEDNHQKLIHLMKAFEEKVSREKKLAFENNVTMINKCLETIESQVDAISKGLATEEARMRETYIDGVKAELDLWADNWDDMVKLTEDNEELSKSNANLLEKIDKLNADIVNLNKDIENLEEDKNKLTSENNELFRVKVDHDATVSSIKDAYEVDIKNHLSSIASLKDKLSAATAKLEQVEEENKKLDTKLVTLSEERVKEIDSYRAKIENVRIESNKKDLAIEKLNDDLNAEKSKKTTLEQEVNDLKKSIVSKDELIGIHLESVKTLKSETSALQKDNNKLNEYIKNLKVEYKGVVAVANEKYNELSSKYEGASLELKTAKVENQILSDNYNDSKAKLNQLEVDLKGANEKIASSDAKIFKLEFELNALKEKYNALLENEGK